MSKPPSIRHGDPHHPRRRGATRPTTALLAMSRRMDMDRKRQAMDPVKMILRATLSDHRVPRTARHQTQTLPTRSSPGRPPSSSSSSTTPSRKHNRTSPQSRERRDNSRKVRVNRTLCQLVGIQSSEDLLNRNTSYKPKSPGWKGLGVKIPS